MEMIRRTLSRFVRAGVAVPLIVMAVSLVELAIADRKYGVFSGGFGQSNAIDTPGEWALFLSGYAISQIAAAASAAIATVAHADNNRLPIWPP